MYCTSVKTATGFTPFQLTFGLEAILPIECEIPSLKLTVELLPGTTATKEGLLSLDHLDETRRDITNVESKLNMKNISSLVLSKRAISFYSMIRDTTSWGQEPFNHYGLVLT